MAHAACCYLIGAQVCSGITMAVELYRDVEMYPGDSTLQHLLTQHGVRVNGPLFMNPAEGPACLLTAMKETGQLAVVKMLDGVVKLDTQQQQAGGNEGAAYRCAPRTCRRSGWLSVPPLCATTHTASRPSTTRAGACTLTSLRACR